MAVPPIPPNAPLNVTLGDQFNELLLREGEPVTFFGYGSATPASSGTVNVVVANGTFAPTVGKTVWMTGMTGSSNLAAVMQLGIGGDAGGKFPAFVHQFIGPGPCTISLNMAYRGFEELNGGPALNVRQMLSLAPTTDTIWGTVTVTGWKITDDFNFTASKPVLYVGDSIIGGTGPTATQNMYPWIAKTNFNTLGYDTRIILKSVSGSTTANHETWRSAGYHDVLGPALIVYVVGVNDAVGSVAAGTYTTNITAFWQWVKYRYPQSKMIICGPTPVQNDTTSGFLDQYRTAASNYVTSENNPRLKYVNLGDSFDRTNTAFYIASDPAGSKIHPNDAGHAAIGSNFNTKFNALGLPI